jgi:hypothetical protein
VFDFRIHFHPSLIFVVTHSVTLQSRKDCTRVENTLAYEAEVPKRFYRLGKRSLLFVLLLSILITMGLMVTFSAQFSLCLTACLSVPFGRGKNSFSKNIQIKGQTFYKSDKNRFCNNELISCNNLDHLQISILLKAFSTHIWQPCMNHLKLMRSTPFSNQTNRSHYPTLLACIFITFVNNPCFNIGCKKLKYLCFFK